MANVTGKRSFATSDHLCCTNGELANVMQWLRNCLFSGLVVPLVAAFLRNAPALLVLPWVLVSSRVTQLYTFSTAHGIVVSSSNVRVSAKADTNVLLPHFIFGAEKPSR